MPRLILFDPDRVEEHNLGSQAFLNSAIGQSKVGAMEDKLSLVSEVEVYARTEMFNDQEIPDGTIVACLPDSMMVRKTIWEDRIKYNPYVPLYIEARMGGLSGRIYAIHPFDPDEIELYEKTLYGSDEVEGLPCTARGVDFNCSGIADFIAAVVAAHVVGRSHPKEILIDFEGWQVIMN